MKANVVPSQNLPQSKIQSKKCDISSRESRLKRRTDAITSHVSNTSSKTENFHDKTEVQSVGNDGNDAPETTVSTEQRTEIIAKSCMDQMCQVDTLSVPLKRTILTQLIMTEAELSTSTGIATFCLFETIVEILMDYEKDEDHTRDTLKPVDRVMLVFLKLKQNLSYAFMAILFHVSSITVSRIFSKTLVALRVCLQCAVYWPKRDEINHNMPTYFDGEFSSVNIVLDCTEVAIQQLKCLNCRISSYSHYINIGILLNF